jgi:hypothetical protein
MRLNQINIVTVFPEDEFPLDISTAPVEIGGLDYEVMGF